MKVLIVEDQFVEANDLRLMLCKAGYEVCGIARSVNVALDMIKKETPDLVLLDIFLKGDLTGIDLARQLRAENIAFVYLSANSNEEILSMAKTTEPYGFIVKPFRQKDLLVTLEIAQYRHEHSREARYRRETGLMLQLEELAGKPMPWQDRLLEMGKILQQEIPFDYLAMGFGNAGIIENGATSFLRIGFNEYQVIGLRELSTIARIPVNELVNRIASAHKDGFAGILQDEAFERSASRPSLTQLAQQLFHIESLLTFPVQLDNEDLFKWCFYSRRPDIYHTDHIALLYQLQQVLTRNLERKPAAVPTTVHPQPVDSYTNSTGHKDSNALARNFEGIVGKSHLLFNVFDQIAQVAPFDTAVLLLGESGTGKERMADAIHQLSARKGRAFIKVNCAALPATLIESELFGHEKGAFTGAIDKRTGRFEQAHGGTILLDEIGDMPIDLQVKLLRVLQEKEIEPIGGRLPVKIDVRVIAATNRNLEKEVAEGRFRLDLYYRLNVFPILLPALRERRDDILLLVDHFIHIYNRKSGKKITGVSDRVLDTLRNYSWPGNIRELENAVERSVLLARGTMIEDLALPAIQPGRGIPYFDELPVKSFNENERDYIISILNKCNGKIWGVGGAAEILKVPPSTLKSKMKKLGIQKKY